MKELLYVIGVPGAGKTTLIDALLDGVPYELCSKPFEHRQYPGGVVLGGLRGTDTLGMSVQPLVLQWLDKTPAEVVLGEGDRLGNGSFFRAVQTLGWTLCIYHLDTPEHLAVQRRVERGSNQDPVWMKGRRTKVRELAATGLFEVGAPVHRIRLNGAEPVAGLVWQLRQNEAVMALRGEGLAVP